MTGIRVHRSVHIEQPSILEEAMVGGIGYVHPTKNVLMESVTYGGQREYYFTARHIADSGYTCPPSAIRRSDDNGRSWRVVEQLILKEPLDERRYRDHFPPRFIHHPTRNVILRLWYANESIPGLLSWDKGSPALVSGKMFIQRSTDGGKTWSERRQMIDSRPGYDESHWGPEITYGQNYGVAEFIYPIYYTADQFVMPFYIRDVADGADEGFRCASTVLRGRWRDDGWVDWQIGSYVRLDQTQSDQGAAEPCVALLPNGRLFMTMRMRKHAESKVAIPSGRFFSISSDLGETWSEPKLLTYDDGQVVYCPACLGQVLRSAKNNRLYYITNICDKPAVQCDPRTTLQVAEIDPKTFCVLRDTVTVIETRQPDQLDTIRFSNWAFYEDRETKNPIVVMTGCPGDQGRHEQCNVPPHSYRYEIEVP